jgi:hypothetical protein
MMIAVIYVQLDSPGQYAKIVMLAIKEIIAMIVLWDIIGMYQNAFCAQR